MQKVEWFKRPVSSRTMRLLVLLAFSLPLVPAYGWFVLVLAPFAIPALVGVELTTKQDSWRAIFTPAMRLFVLLMLSGLLVPVSGWFVLVFAPFVNHVLVGFKRTAKRDAWRALLSPSMLVLPLCLALWARSYQVMSYCLVSVGTQEFLGGYLFPGVIEIGFYEHDPAGVKYLELGVTPEIADVMTGDIRRFRSFEGSKQVFDGFCLYPMYCRETPVVEGWFSAGTIYAGHSSESWTPGSFYTHSGPWARGSAYRTYHIGFHFLVPVLASAVFSLRSIRRWRLHERRLRRGLCVTCGYDLTGNESGICPECGRAWVAREGQGFSRQ